jgi:hypothetical protein
MCKGVKMPTHCIHENCTLSPSYNLPTEKTGLYCKQHIKENMIDIISISLFYDFYLLIKK